MTLALVLVVGLGWWLHKEGALVPTLRRWGLVAVLVVAGLRLLEAGNFAIAAAVLAGAVAAWFVGRPRVAAEPNDEAEARAVLGVAAHDDATAINAAWRRAIARAHPDRGGTADLAHRVTAARDLLLARVPR